MLGRVTIIGAFSVALYTGDQQAWNAFYLFLGIGFLRFLVRFIAHRRKYAKFVCPIPRV